MADQTALRETDSMIRTQTNAAGQMVLPGDSGGPCFQGDALAGVTSQWFLDLGGGRHTSVTSVRDWIYQTVPQVPEVVGFGDVNGDGRKDLVARGRLGTNAGRFLVFRGTDRGIDTSYWYSPNDILDDGSKVWLGDVNRDGRADVVAQAGRGMPNAGYLFTAITDGAGFPSWSWGSSSRAIDDNARVWVAGADLVAQGARGQGNAGYLFVAASDGQGYPNWSWGSGGRVLDDYANTWLADVNGDGRPDLVAKGAPGAENAGQVYVAIHDGTGYPSWSWSSGARVLDDGAKVWLADVNGDGAADLIAQGAPGSANAGFVYVALSNGSGYPSWSWNSGARMLDDGAKAWFADVNGDGAADLVAQGAPESPNAGYVYLALSSGGGYPAWSWNSPGRAVDDDAHVWLADVTGDGKADLIAQAAGGRWNAGNVYSGISTGAGFELWTSAVAF